MWLLLCTIMCTIGYYPFSVAAEAKIEIASLNMNPSNSEQLPSSPLVDNISKSEPTGSNRCKRHFNNAGICAAASSFGMFVLPLFAGPCAGWPVFNDYNCLKDYQVKTHVYFVAAVTGTMGGYCFTGPYWLSQYKKYKERMYSLNSSGCIKNKIGKSAQWFGKMCLVAGAPLLPMGIAWGEATLYKDRESDLMASGNHTIVPDDAISREIMVAKNMTLVGTVLTTVGAASWLIGKQLAPDSHTTTQ